MMKLVLKTLLVLGSVLALSNCTALTNIENASQSLDIFELRPVSFEPANPARGTRSILVERPTSSGTLSTDRIVIKPTALEVKYLPGVRWAEESPAHFQRLLATSLGNSGRFGLVALEDVGTSPDFLLLSDLSAFQAAISESDELPPSVTIRATLTIIRDEDRSILGTKSFLSEERAGTDDAIAVINAFDTAMQRLLGEMLKWTITKTR